MTLTEEEIKAIEREAEKAYYYPDYKFEGTFSGDYITDMKRDAYAEGIIHERIKSNELVKALEEIKSWAVQPRNFNEEIFGIAVKAINEFQNNKQWTIRQKQKG